MEHVLHAIVAILIRPEVSTAMDHTTLNNYHHFPCNYKSCAKESAEKAAKCFKGL